MYLGDEWRMVSIVITCMWRVWLHLTFIFQACMKTDPPPPPFSHTPGLQLTLKHFSASEIGGVIEIPVPYMSLETCRYLFQCWDMFYHNQWRPSGLVHIIGFSCSVRLWRSEFLSLFNLEKLLHATSWPHLFRLSVALSLMNRICHFLLLSQLGEHSFLD